MKSFILHDKVWKRSSVIKQLNPNSERQFCTLYTIRSQVKLEETDTSAIKEIFLCSFILLSFALKE